MMQKFDHSSSSHSGDMVGAHQNLNVSYDLHDHTYPSGSGMVCHHGLSLAIRSTYVPNLQSLYSLPTTKISKAAQNIENGVIWDS